MSFQYPADQAASCDRILIADGDHCMRGLLAKNLVQWGYDVITVKDGNSCLTQYQQEKPDLVLLDLRMPNVDIFECCRQIKALEYRQYTPILVITAVADDAAVDAAFAAGASDFVHKPLHMAVLRQRIKNFLRQARWQRSLEEANRRLEDLIRVDDLTQLTNYRGCMERLEQEWRRLAREHLPLSLLLLDVDYFKLYNDTYGHAAGNVCLQAVAAALRTVVRRPADLTARYGGEEFAILLPNTHLDGAVHVAARLREAIHSLNIPHQASKVSNHLTLTIGVACGWPSPRISSTDLIELADQALYRGKHQGRDLVMPATDIIGLPTADCA